MLDFALVNFTEYPQKVKKEVFSHWENSQTCPLQMLVFGQTSHLSGKTVVGLQLRVTARHYCCFNISLAGIYEEAIHVVCTGKNKIGLNYNVGSWLKPPRNTL